MNASVWRRETGQATVEFVALVPVVASVALLVAGLLAGQQAREAADGAAVAAALAALQGGDPERAARDALPGWARARVRVSDGRASVVVRWRGPSELTRFIDASREVRFAVGGAP